MVIQRIQSLYLLLAALVLAALCFFVPVGVVQDFAAETHQFVFVKDCLSPLILGLVTMALLIVDIFLYKNLPLQIRVAGVCIAMLVAMAVVGALVLGWRMPENVSVMWVGPALVLVSALVLTAFARRGMRADQRVLKSYDRIR